MSDQCEKCEVRGNYERCIKTECFHHENWISKQQKERIRILENNWVKAEMLLNAVGEALDGEKVSDFEESYPIVRKAQDAYYHSQVRRT
jgi:hypothetical protein